MLITGEEDADVDKLVFFMKLRPFGEIEIKKITVPDDLLRQDLGDIQQLVDSIKKCGLDNPITVQQVGDKIVLRKGRRRLEAFKRMRKSKIPYKLESEGKRDDNRLMVLMRQVAENRVRKDFTPLEDLRAVLELTKEAVEYIDNDNDAGAYIVNLHMKLWKKEKLYEDEKKLIDVLKGAGYSNFNFLSKLMRLRKLNKNIIERVEYGNGHMINDIFEKRKISFSHAIELSTLKAEKQEKIFERIFKEKMKVSELRKEIRKEKGRVRSGYGYRPVSGLKILEEQMKEKQEKEKQEAEKKEDIPENDVETIIFSEGTEVICPHCHEHFELDAFEQHELKVRR
ncbi:MAG TPA: hypothetical protein ENG51_04535 [Deltaproteobacteria bacterium]|nr:hypothetical protein [Deltaproteobacteria bacterium]